MPELVALRPSSTDFCCTNDLLRKEVLAWPRGVFPWAADWPDARVALFGLFSLLLAWAPAPPV